VHVEENFLDCVAIPSPPLPIQMLVYIFVHVSSCKAHDQVRESYMIEFVEIDDRVRASLKIVTLL